MNKKNKEMCFIVIALALGLIMALLFSEITLRLLKIPWLDQRMKELSAGNQENIFGSDYGWPTVILNGKFKCFVPFSKFTINHYEYKSVAHIDQWGGRVTAKESAASKDRIIIPFFGDSFTFGVGVQDRETFVSLIDSKIGVRCINLGIPGTNLTQQLDVLEMRHHELGEPRIYVFSFFLGNDLDIYNKSIVSSPEESKKTIWENALRLDRSNKLNAYVYHNRFLKKIFLLQFIREKLLVMYNKKVNSIAQLKDPVFLSMDKRNERYRELIDTTLESELQRLVEISTHLKFRPIFIIIPDKHQVYSDLLFKKARFYGMKQEDIDFQLPNRIIEDKLMSKKIIFVDLLEYLRDHKNERLYYIQDNHFTPLGHKLVAEYVYPWLKKIISKENIL